MRLFREANTNTGNGRVQISVVLGGFLQLPFVQSHLDDSMFEKTVVNTYKTESSHSPGLGIVEGDGKRPYEPESKFLIPKHKLKQEKGKPPDRKQNQTKIK